MFQLQHNSERLIHVKQFVLEPPIYNFVNLRWFDQVVQSLISFILCLSVKEMHLL